MGVYCDLTVGTEGYYLIDDITSDPADWQFFFWDGADDDPEYACIEDSGFYGGVYYPAYVGPFNFWVYYFHDMGFDIPSCPVFMRTDVRGGAGGVSFFDAQSFEVTAPAAIPSMWPLSDRIQTVVQYDNVTASRLVWKKVVPLEEPDYEFTPYQDTLVDGEHPSIAAFEDGHVVIVYSDPADAKIKCLTSDDDGANWSSPITITDGGCPDVTAVYDQVEQQAYFYAAYVFEDDLYISYSTDFGATWQEFADNPINDEVGSAVEDIKCVDIHQKGGIVWIDNRGDDYDIYFDQYFIPPALELTIGEVSGGLGTISSSVENTGDILISDATYSIEVKGGILGRIDVLAEGDVDPLNVSDTQTISTEGMIFGLGKITFNVKASYADTKAGTGLIIGPFILNLQES
jgi:hypothetical protein